MQTLGVDAHSANLMFHAQEHLHPPQPVSSLAGTNPSVPPRGSGQLHDGVLALLCVTSGGVFDITIGPRVTLGTPLNSFTKKNQRKCVEVRRRRGGGDCCLASSFVVKTPAGLRSSRSTAGDQVQANVTGALGERTDALVVLFSFC